MPKALAKKTLSAAPKAAPKNAKQKILLVEDDTFLAGMYVTKLSLEHFQVVLATDGRQGVKMAKEEKPDAVLLDIVLPKMDGFQVLSAIRKDPVTAKTPVILLTNLGQKSDVDRGLALGANDYLIKAHFLPSEVIAKLKKLIG